MLPQSRNDLSTDIVFKKQASKTYRINIEQKKILDYCNSREAIKQAVYKILNTERYECPIYSWNYGIELKALFGKPVSYCIPEIERRVREALLQDDRISKVFDFIFEIPGKGVIHTKFKVMSTEGIIEAEKEVRI